MKHFTAILLSLMLLTFFACNRSDGEVTLRIAGQFQEKDFALNTPYTSSSGQYMEFIDFKFYLSNIVLIDEKDEEVELSEVILYKFKTPENIQAAVPSGTYKAIRFDIGLNEDLNASDPNTFEVEHPLSYAHNTHWDWASMYRFVMMDGRVDTTQADNFAKTFSYHTGFDDLWRTTTIEQEFTVSEEENTNLVLNLQIDQIFNGSKPVDVFEENVSHSLTDIATRLSDNFVESLSLEVQ